MLTRDEIHELIAAFGEACHMIGDLQRRVPVAKHVQFPKVPTILSESIAALAIREGMLLAAKGPFSSIRRGGRTAEILAVTSMGQELRIETKASGLKDFATFGAKDYNADFLLWLRFRSVLRENSLGIVEVLIGPNPGLHLPWNKSRVTVPQLKAGRDGELVPEYVD